MSVDLQNIFICQNGITTTFSFDVFFKQTYLYVLLNIYNINAVKKTRCSLVYY